SEEHTSELQSLTNLVCRLLLEKKKKTPRDVTFPLGRPRIRDRCWWTLPPPRVEQQPCIRLQRYGTPMSRTSTPPTHYHQVCHAATLARCVLAALRSASQPDVSSAVVCQHLCVSPHPHRFFLLQFVSPSFRPSVPAFSFFFFFK